MNINRDFEMFGIKFHLNDNRIGINKSNYNLFPKWKLLEYVPYYKRWEVVGCFNTKSEAVAYIKREYL